MAAITWRNSGGCQAFKIISKGDGFVIASWGKWVITSCYISPNCDVEEFEEFLDGLGRGIAPWLNRPLLVMGDFNAKSETWGKGRTNVRGEILEEWAGDKGLWLLNEGRNSTCVRVQGESTVDLSWASAQAVKDIRTWWVDLKSETLSDHRYIGIELKDR